MNYGWMEGKVRYASDDCLAESPAGGGINSLGVSRCPMGTVIIAYGDEDTKRHAIAKGAIGLLTKPLDFTLLREEIDTRLGPAN